MIIWLDFAGMGKYYNTSRTGKPEGMSASTRSREFVVISSVYVVGGDINRTPATMRCKAIFRTLYSQAASRKNYISPLAPESVYPYLLLLSAGCV